uniref:Uncharacterized protein LOC114345966 n=1 Tax=Diabrotica virgifera virgifera TaxID=50390 RepID=A0A6P7H4G6_DIAVI
MQQDEGQSSSNNDDSTICIICDKIIQRNDSTHEVKLNGIPRFIKSSKARKDNKHKIMETLSSFVIHNTCYCVYNRENSIAAAIKRMSKNLSDTRKEYAKSRAFDFANTCFFCEKSVKVKSDLVRCITSMDTLTNIIETAEQKEHGKEKLKNLIYRLKQITDLEIEKPKYHSTCLTSFYYYQPFTSRGRPISEKMSEALTFVISHILNNEEVCQFSLKEILSEFKGNDVPQLKYLQKSLEDHFGDEIKIYSTKKDYFICFRDSKGRIIDDEWYSKRKANREEERLRIVQEAANIVLEDIRLQRHDLSKYDVPTSITSDIFSDLPLTLKEFVKIVVVTHKQSTKENGLQKWYNQAATIGHILMSAARPRAFVSKILLGLSVLIHRKFASKDLINLLSNIGLCENYKETVRFEASIMKDPQNFTINTNSFIQFIWDNADHNTRTIDGHGTFHTMGGILSVTPAKAVTTKQDLLRLPNIPKVTDTGDFGFLPLISSDKDGAKGLSKVIVKILPDLKKNRNC